MDNRFKKTKKRITAFAYTQNCLRTGIVFYIPSGKVKGTASVQMNYIVHRKINNVSPTGITQNGINIGIRSEKGVYTPLTILIYYLKNPNPKNIPKILPKRMVLMI